MTHLHTSYFAKYRGSSGISIARGTPSWFKGKTYSALSPSWNLIRFYKETGDSVEYERQYLQQLNQLSAEKIYEELYSLVKDEIPVLLYYEKPGDFCHRNYVADWFRNKFNISVTEL